MRGPWGLQFLLAIGLLLAGPPTLPSTDKPVVLGVLAYRGEELALTRWSPLATYLHEQIDERQFVVQPFTLDGLEQALRRDEVDFILTNPGHYVVLESAFGISRLVTLRNLRQGRPYTVFGAVIIVRADRGDLQVLTDLRNKTFMAVDEDAFGGFQMAWGELKDLGVDPFSDLAELQFHGFPQDDIVYAVHDGVIDAGTVRTDTLERMAQEGKIAIADYRVLNARTTAGFPYRHSTRLYPEWPLAKARHTDEMLAQRVAVALLTMPAEHPAARAGKYAGWTVPLDYQPVHELFRDLHIGPYARHGEVSLEQFLERYWHWFALGAGALLVMLATTTYVAHLNRRLRNEFRRRQQFEATMRKLSSVVVQTADAVIITDRNGFIEYVNPAFEHVSGYRREEALGKKPNILKSGRHEEAFYRQLWDTLLSGQPFRNLFINRRKDGGLFYEEKSITPLRDARGEITHFVSAGRDVTARMLAEEEARRHRDELARVGRVSLMGEMTSGIAHELNQPLTAIVNYAEGCARRLRADNYDRADILAAIERVAAQAQRAGDIIKHLRHFVTGREPERAVADVNALVRRTIALIEPELLKDGVLVSLELADHPPPVQANVIQIEQVVLNLLRNAEEAMADSLDERQIGVRTLVNDQYLEVAVSDTGPGFGTSSEQLFEAFFTTKSGGMGLGLAISRTIIETHGGRLWAERNGAHGAVFRFTLPLQGAGHWQ